MTERRWHRDNRKCYRYEDTDMIERRCRYDGTEMREQIQRRQRENGTEMTERRWYRDDR